MRTDDDGQLLGSDDEVGPPMKPQVREAGLEDLDLLMAWRMEVLREVFDLPADQPLDALEEANRRYYLAALPTGEHVACFATLDGRIVGCGGICLQKEMPSPDNPSGMNGYLMNIYTRPRYRGRGVGEAVVTWLLDRARGLGAEKVYLETSADGRHLYERMGFRDLPDYMKLCDTGVRQASAGAS